MAVALSYRFCFLTLLANLLNLNPTGHVIVGHSTNVHVALFVFGDSLFDPGNNNFINTTTQFQANFSPYGETFFNYPTGRFSDGRLLPDFIAEYAKLPLIPPYLQPGNHQFIYGANFASGGAGALVETYAGMVINLETQMGYFKDVEKQLKQKLGDKEAKKLLSNSVYLFSIGSNDYLSPTATNSISHSHTREEYVKMVIGNLTVAIEEVYEKGGRKFGFLTLKPLGCIPGRRKNDNNCEGEETAITELHNKALTENLKKLNKQLKGFMLSFFDFYTALSKRINNPSKYGFKDGKNACCGSGPYRGNYSCGGKRGERV